MSSDLRREYQDRFDEEIVRKDVIAKAIKDGKIALELTKIAAKKLNTAENLCMAEGAIGSIISSISMKKGTKAGKEAEEAVNKFNESLDFLGGFDRIYMSPDADSRLDNVLFSSAGSSLMANMAAVTRRAKDAIITIEAALEKLDIMAKETNKTISLLKENLQ